MRALQVCHRTASTASLSWRGAHLQSQPRSTPAATQKASATANYSSLQSCPVSAGTDTTETHSKVALAAAAAGVMLTTAIHPAFSDATTAPSTSLPEQSSESDSPIEKLDLFSLSLDDANPVRATPAPQKSEHEALFESVAAADASAVQTLSTMLSESGAHERLLSEGVLPALVRALDAAESNRAVQLSVLRMLADLAQSSPSHTAFTSEGGGAGLYTSLCPVLQRTVTASREPWASWTSRLLSAPEPPLQRVARLRERQLTQNDFSLLDVSSTSGSGAGGSGGANLDEGIVYHALRCLSSLSKHTQLHADVLATPLLPLVCQLLNNISVYYPEDSTSAVQHYTDVLKFATMVVSALAKSAPIDIVNNRSHVAIIALSSQAYDPVVQTYAMGGLRNLARHPPPTSASKDMWKAHREIVVAGIDKSLIECMKSSNSSNAHSKSFAIATFTDLMTSGHFKSHLIRRKLSTVFPHYSELLKDRNNFIFRSVAKSLNRLLEYDSYLSTPNRERTVNEVLSKDLIDLLGEQSGLFLNYAIKVKDTSAMKAINSMCGLEHLNQRMVDKGILEYIKNELLAKSNSKNDYLEQCIGIISTLSNYESYRKLIIDKQFMRLVLNNSAISQNDGLEVSKFLANMARSPELCVDIAHNGLKVLLRSLQSKTSPEAVNHSSRALYNLSLEGFSKVIVSQSGSITPIVKSIQTINSSPTTTSSSSCAETRKFLVGTLVEISESFELATTLIEADIIKTLLDSIPHDASLRRDVARCFAQMSQVPEVHGSLVKHGAAKWLADIVSSSSSFTDSSAELTQYAIIAICNLAYSPGITRSTLIENGVLRSLTGISISNLGSPIMGHGAKQALANLRGIEKPTMLPSESIPKFRQPQ